MISPSKQTLNIGDCWCNQKSCIQIMSITFVSSMETILEVQKLPTGEKITLSREDLMKQYPNLTARIPMSEERQNPPVKSCLNCDFGIWVKTAKPCRYCILSSEWEPASDEIKLWIERIRRRENERLSKGN